MRQRVAQGRLVTVNGDAVRDPDAILERASTNVHNLVHMPLRSFVLSALVLSGGGWLRFGQWKSRARAWIKEYGVKTSAGINQVSFAPESYVESFCHTMQQAGATCLALEAEKTLLFDREAIVAAADAAGIAITVP